MSADHTDYLETTLTALIKQHGASTVQQHLSVLLPRANWQDWQRLANLTAIIAMRMERKQI